VTDNHRVMRSDLTELILDRAHDAVISVDEAGRVTYWNQRAEAMFDLTRTEATGRYLRELIIPERLREAHEAGIRRFLNEGVGPVLDRRIELPALRRDGTEFPVEMTISALREGPGWIFTAFVQDISSRAESQQERERLVDELRRTLVGSERRFDTVVGSLVDPVTIRDRQHRIIYANQAALSHLGYSSWEELRGTPPAQIMAGYRVLGEDGGEISMEDIPSVRILRGEPAEPLLIQTINHETGIQRWNLLKAAPLLDEGGEVEATIMVIEDVTTQKREERHANLLAEASRVLASSLDYEQTLRNVAELAVPDVADWCAVDLIDEDGDRVPVAVAHTDRRRLELAAELRRYDPSQPDPNQGLGYVLRTGESVLYPDVADELLVLAAVDERHLELLRAVGMRSVAIVPIRVHTKILGTLTLVNAQSGRVLEGTDLKLAEQIADRAAVAIENARLYSERSRVAQTLQQSLLPDRLPDVPGYELASLYRPAVESSQVGGDFYDVWEAAGSWLVAIGDVTGKGIEAAALTALVRHTLRATSEFVSSPAELLSRLDRVLQKQSTRSICTALCLRLGPDGIVLAVGGHPLPYCITTDRAATVGEHGPLLGGFTDAEWRDVAIEFPPGSTLLVYTDGVTDAVGPGPERYGQTRLQDTLDQCRGLSASRVLDTLTQALGAFQIGSHADDTAALAIHRLALVPISDPPGDRPPASSRRPRSRGLSRSRGTRAS
jgi:PAS domain S-box-containing protein